MQAGFNLWLLPLANYNLLNRLLCCCSSSFPLFCYLEDKAKGDFPNGKNLLYVFYSSTTSLGFLLAKNSTWKHSSLFKLFVLVCPIFQRSFQNVQAVNQFPGQLSRTVPRPEVFLSKETDRCLRQRLVMASVTKKKYRFPFQCVSTICWFWTKCV